MVKKCIKKDVKKSKFLSNNSNTVIVGLLALAVVLTVFGTLVNIDNLTKLNFGNLGLTAAATSGTGNASVTIQGSASMVMTVDSINFPTGYYNESCISTKNYSILMSNIGLSDCWLNASGIVPSTSSVQGNHTITNTGTTYLSINVSTSTSNGTALFCAATGCTITDGANANVSVKSGNAESGSCGSGSLSSFTALLTQTTNNTVTVCSLLDYADVSDTLAVYYQFVIPKDSSQGAKVLTVTYTATAQ